MKGLMLGMIEFPEGKYSILLVDPPWSWKNYSDETASRWVGDQYDLLSTEQLCKLPVGDLGADNSVLFLWSIFTMLPDAFKVIENWGYTYKTAAFVWVKQDKIADSLFTGMGYYTRSNAELCLLATKGKPLPRESHKVRQIVLSHRREPPEVRDRIVELFGDVPRIELFARDRAKGWSAWGKELPSE